MTNHVVDLTPATDALLPHALRSLEAAEKFNGEFSSKLPFIWRPASALVALAAFALAKPTEYFGEFELHLSFPGPDGSKFRTAHTDRLIEEVAKVLTASGWEIIPIDDNHLAATGADGIFFTMKRSEAQVSPAE